MAAIGRTPVLTQGALVLALSAQSGPSPFFAALKIHALFSNRSPPISMRLILTRPGADLVKRGVAQEAPERTIIG